MQNPKRTQRGNTLLIVLMTTTIIGLVLATNLELVSNQNQATHRSLAWNTAMPVCEAGIEEALTHLNWCTSNGKRLLVNVDLAQNGWTFTGTNYAKTRTLTDSYYTVNISSTINPVILCSGYLKAPLGTNYVCRTVQVM